MKFTFALCFVLAIACVSSQEASDTTTLVPPTLAPTTASPPPPPPTTVAPPVPTPSPKPDLITPTHYEFSKDNVTCIEADFSLQVSVEYVQELPKENRTVTSYLNFNGTVDHDKSSCGNETQTLAILFDNAVPTQTAQLIFELKDKNYFLSKIELEYYTDSSLFPGHQTPNKSIPVTYSNLTLFEVDETKSYYCKTPETRTQEKVSFTIANVHLDAFRTAPHDNKFRARFECSSDEHISDLVPIAVGIALLALVVIVLIAYFIGRRRSRRLAYQSV